MYQNNINNHTISHRKLSEQVRLYQQKVCFIAYEYFIFC